MDAINQLGDFMNWWQAIILGVIQGLTEYLPVSSSGHLAITELLFGLYMPVSVDVLMHLATLVPTIWIFRKKIVSLLMSLCSIIAHVFRNIFTNKKCSLAEAGLADDGRYILLVLVVTAFTFVIAYPQKDLDLKFYPMLIASAFLFTAALLLLQHLLLRKREASMPQVEAIQSKAELSNILLTLPLTKALAFAACIGVAQGVAVLPGVSRSGMTISVALLLGLRRRDAGEFSFIISIPVIIGALLMQLGELQDIAQMTQQDGGLSSMLLAFAAACLSGFLALRLLLVLLQKGNFYLFSFYLILLSAFSFWFFAS